MPSTYAHFRIGQEIRNMLPATYKKIVDAYPDLYNIGLHGPDILFYHKPLFANEISHIGFEMHEHSGKEIFGKFAQKLHKINSSSDSESSYGASLSYIIGFLCHYTLDSNAHSYIENKIKISGVSHTEIEVEFDRFLMIKDGLDPITHPLTRHLKDDLDTAVIISNFFNLTSPEQVQISLKNMTFYNNLLLCRTDFKRHLVRGILRLTGNFPEMHGLIVNKVENPLCSDSNLRLMKIYEKSKDDSLILIDNFYNFLKNNQELSKRFNLIFGANEGWENIPVLNFEEEKFYEVHA